MSQQHPANTPATTVDLTERPATAPDPLLDEARSALELAEWTPQDQLSIYAHGLVAECTCGCIHSTTVTGRIAPEARDLATLAATATNLLPALVERLTTAETELAQYVRDIEPVDELRAQLELANTAADNARVRERVVSGRLEDARLNRDRARHDLGEAQRRIGELTAEREQAAELITGLTDLVRQVADELGVPAYADRQIMPTLRRALHDSVAAQARAERLQRQLADVGALASGWVEHAAGDRTALLGADTLIQAVRDLAAAEVK